MLTLKVEGFAQAKKIMDDLPNNLQKRMLLAALRGSAKPLLSAARKGVPVKSGKLRKNLRIIRFKERSAARSEVAVAVKPIFEKTKKKGALNGFYGRMIHEGTTDRRKPKKAKFLTFENPQGERVFVKSTKGLKPTPYLQTAYNETGGRTVELFGDELAKAVERFTAKNYKAIK